MSRSAEERERLQDFNGWVHVDKYGCGCRLEGRGTEDIPVRVDWCLDHIYTEQNLREDGDILFRDVVASCLSGAAIDADNPDWDARVGRAALLADAAVTAWKERFESFQLEAFVAKEKP